MNEHSMTADFELYATAEAAGSSAVRIEDTRVQPAARDAALQAAAQKVAAE